MYPIQRRLGVTGISYRPIIPNYRCALATYRPVSLTSARISKVMESLIRDEITEYIEISTVGLR